MYNVCIIIILLSFMFRSIQNKIHNSSLWKVQITKNMISNALIYIHKTSFDNKIH